MTVGQSVSVLRQILSALTWLHRQSPKTMHRDIKSANILARENTPRAISAVLGAFGMCGRGILTQKKWTKQSHGQLAMYVTHGAHIWLVAGECRDIRFSGRHQ